MPCFIVLLMTFSVLIETTFVIVWEMFHGRMSLNSVLLLLAAKEFCGRVQVGIDVYIPHCKYQVNPHSSPWFSAAYAAAIVHRNHFFSLYQQNESSESKVMLRQASNCYERVLEAAEFAYAVKTKKSITLQKLGSQDFAELLLVFSTKVNLLCLLY